MKSPTLVMLVTMGYCLLQLQLQQHLVHAWTSTTNIQTQVRSSGNRFARRGIAGSHVEQLRPLGLAQRLRPLYSTVDNDDDRSGSSATIATTATTNAPTKSSPRPRPCYYQVQKGEGQRLLRRQLPDLVPGQALQAFQVVSENLDAQTGPKIYLDVGVGRYRVNTKIDVTKAVTVWSIVTAMVRLGGPNMKPSVGRKKAAKIRQKCDVVPEKITGADNSERSKTMGLTVYVTKIDTASVRLEVSVDPADGKAAAVKAAAALKKASKAASSASTASTTPKQQQQPSSSAPAPVSSLHAGQELQGTIERVEDYGCLVRIPGVKRHGLLRIQSVADLYGTYIGKRRGLIEAGLERNVAIKVQVAEVTGKRLLLDFTNVTKEQALEEQKEKAEVKREEVEVKEEKIRQRREQFNRRDQPQESNYRPPIANVTAVVATPATTPATELSPEEEAAWAAYASKDQDAEEEKDDDDEDDDDDDDDYDEYDEDRDIEDSLGLGSY